MTKFLEFLLQLLGQFAGGPGPMENNLVRFSIPAVTYGALMIVAWSRQRQRDLPRERLLVWGFALGSASAILMAAFVSLQLLDAIERETTYAVLIPLERALAMASIVVIAGAFLRYSLDDARMARVYIWVGLGATCVCMLIALWQWPGELAMLTEHRFHTSWLARVFQLSSSVLIIVAIVLLRRKRGWLANVVTIALIFFLTSDLLFLVNYATDKSYNRILCPIGNSFPLLAAPLLGYVYLYEQTIDKKRAERDLEAHRDHLEELVVERTAEIAAVNAQLKDEVREREKAEAEIARRNADLAAQNAVAAALSRSLDLETILDTTMDAVLSVVKTKVGLAFLWDTDLEELTLHSYHGPPLQDGVKGLYWNGSCYKAISAEVMSKLRPIVRAVSDDSDKHSDSLVIPEDLETLVSVPLVSSGRALGALTLGFGETESVQPRELELLSAIGQQIGMAIENARLYQAAEQVAERLTLLHQISTVLTCTLDAHKLYDQIVEQSVKVLNCQVACILEWNESKQRAKIASVYGPNGAKSKLLQVQSDTSDCLQELVCCRETIVVGNAQTDPRIPHTWREKLDIRALLCIPISGMENSYGSLFLIDLRSMRRWRSEEIMLMESFVNRAAVALMNAHLVRQLEWAAALEERQAIAADMHDGLAQTVSLLGLQIDGAMDLIATGTSCQAVQELSIARETIQQVSTAVRRSIASLQRTPQPRRSLQELLSNLLEHVSRESEHPIDYIFRIEEPLFLPQEQTNQALFVVQEALLNAQHHADAERIILLLECQEHEISITIQDDGIGFEPGAWWEASSDHFGLGIMHSRAARIGAKLQVNSRPGEGTLVILTLPLGDGDSHTGFVAPSWDTKSQIPARQGEDDEQDSCTVGRRSPSVPGWTGQDSG